ncbi:hypothetical protein L1049_026880 [Liquidambar formosana]|uniref:Uncharacterized protein n=1 Tax=Liquidambar formosana TaxID=63359 RepID=A0AAP0R6S8_LIQFO
MARLEWGYQGRGKWCSYKRTTLIVCSINIVVALYVLRSLCSSLYIYPYDDSQNAVNYTPDQIRKMEESIRIRRASEPLELIKLVGDLNKEFSREERVVELPIAVKQKITDEILQRLKGLQSNVNASDQREAVESWRKEKLEEAKQLTLGKNLLNSTFLPEEAGTLIEALESNWAILLEEIGVWIPAEVVHNEHEDKPEGEEEFGNDFIFHASQIFFPFVLPTPPTPKSQCSVQLSLQFDLSARILKHI